METQPTDSSDSNSRKRRRVLTGFLIVIALLVAGLLVAANMRPSEPSYQGKPLSYWAQLTELDPTRALQPHLRLTAESDAAVRSIGTNAIPTLLRWISPPENGLSGRASYLLFESDEFPSQLKPLLHSYISREFRPTDARLVFHSLGSLATNAVPSLAEKLHNTQTPDHVAIALLELGPTGVSAFTNGFSRITNRQHRADLVHLATAVRSQDSDLELASFVAELLRNDPDPRVRRASAEAMGVFTNDLEFAVSELTGALNDNNVYVKSAAVGELKKLGAAAASATNAIQRASDEADRIQSLRSEADAAIVAIMSAAASEQ